MYRQLKPPPKVNPRAPPAHLFDPPPSVTHDTHDYEADVLAEMARLEADLRLRLEREHLSQSQQSYHSPPKQPSSPKYTPESSRYDPIPMQQDFDLAYEEPAYVDATPARRKGGGIATLGGEVDDRRNMKAAKAAAYASQLQHQIEDREQRRHLDFPPQTRYVQHEPRSPQDVYERPIYDDRSHISDKQRKHQQQEAYRRQLELQIREKERQKEQNTHTSPLKPHDAPTEGSKWRQEDTSSLDKKRAMAEHRRLLEQQAEEDRRRKEEEKLREEQEDIRLQLAAGNKPPLVDPSPAPSNYEAHTLGAKKRREIEQRRDLERRMLESQNRYDDHASVHNDQAVRVSPSNAARQRQIRDVYGHGGEASEPLDDMSQWRPSGRGQNPDKKRAMAEHRRLLEQQAEEDRRRKEEEKLREEQEDIRLQLAAGGANVPSEKLPIVTEGESLGAKKRREIEQRRELERRMQEETRQQERHDVPRESNEYYAEHENYRYPAQDQSRDMKPSNAALARQLRDVYGHHDEDMPKDAKKRAAQEHRRLLEQQAEEARRRKEEEQRREEEEDIRLQLAAGEPITQAGYDRSGDGMSLGAKKRREIEQRRELERQVQLRLQQEHASGPQSEYRNELVNSDVKKPSMKSPNVARARQIRDVYGHHDSDDLPADAKHRAMLERRRELDQQAEENRLRKEQERKQEEQEDILLDMKVREAQPASLRRADSMSRSPVTKDPHPSPRGSLGAQKRAQIEERRRMEAEIAAQMSPRADNNNYKPQTPERRHAAVAPEQSIESMIGFAHDRTPERASPEARRFGQHDPYQSSQEFGSPSRLSLANVYDNASILSPQRPGYDRPRDIPSGGGPRLKTESAFMPASTIEREYPHEYRRDGVCAEDHFVVEWQQRNGFPSRRGITPAEPSRRLDATPQHVPYVDPFGPDGFLSGLAVKKPKKKKDSNLVEQSLTSESLLFYLNNESAPPSRGSVTSQREYAPKSPLAAMIDESNSRRKVTHAARPPAKKTDSLENLIYSTNEKLQRDLLESRPTTKGSVIADDDSMLLKSSRSERLDVNEDSAEVLIMPPTSAHGTKPRYLDHDEYGERYPGYYDDQMRYQYFQQDVAINTAKEAQRPVSSRLQSTDVDSSELLPSSRASSRRSTKSSSLREYADTRPRSVHSRGSDRPSSKGNNMIANIDYDDDEAIEATWFADK